MKKLLTIAGLIIGVTVTSLLTGCATASSNTAAINTSQKEMMLRDAGFVSKSVTTPQQQAQVAQLSPGVVSAVKYKGKLYYAFPTGAKNQVFIGRQKEYDAYKKALQANAAKVQQQSQTQQNVPAGAYLSGETAGPNRIQVDVFDGFGPLQDQPEWQ